MHVRCAGEGCKHQMSQVAIQQYGSPEALSLWGQNQQAANARRVASLTAEDGAFLAFCSEHARICPGCHVIIYRHAGCNHMTCMCGFEFDWMKAAEAKIAACLQEPRAAAFLPMPLSPLHSLRVRLRDAHVADSPGRKQQRMSRRKSPQRSLRASRSMHATTSSHR